MTLEFRPEEPGEESAIHTLTKQAFAGRPYSDGDEADVIDALRRDGDLLLSLVALQDGEIVGQATYSEARLSNGAAGWMVLGPIAVDMSLQGKGIGRQLMERGEAMMRERGAHGITVLGDPKLYSRFGYQQHTALVLEGELGEYLQVKSFGAPVPDATLTYAPAFG